MALSKMWDDFEYSDNIDPIDLKSLEKSVNFLNAKADLHDNLDWFSKISVVENPNTEGSYVIKSRWQQIQIRIKDSQINNVHGKVADKQNISVLDHEWNEILSHSLLAIKGLKFWWSEIRNSLSVITFASKINEAKSKFYDAVKELWWTLGNIKDKVGYKFKSIPWTWSIIVEFYNQQQNEQFHLCMEEMKKGFLNGEPSTESIKQVIDSYTNNQHEIREIVDWVDRMNMDEILDYFQKTFWDLKE